MLRLYIYNPKDNFDEGLPPSALSLAAYLHKQPDWLPALEETWLVLEVPGGEPMIDLNPFGLLDFLVPQLEEAAERLAAGQLALIRSTGDWTPLFLALQPEGKVTRLSALATIPDPWGAYYPLTKSPFFTPEPVDQWEALYAYVEAHWESLRPGPSASADERALQGVELPTDALVRVLREETHAGRRLLKRLAGKWEK